MVELALVLPLLLVLILGAFDVGRLFYHALLLTNAVRERARRAIDVTYTDVEIQTIVQQAAPELTITSVRINLSPRTNSSSGSVTVSASHKVGSQLRLSKLWQLIFWSALAEGGLLLLAALLRGPA